jgi:hypothetical protein
LVTPQASDGVQTKAGPLEHPQAKHVHDLGVLLGPLKKLAKEVHVLDGGRLWHVSHFPEKRKAPGRFPNQGLPPESPR